MPEIVIASFNIHAGVDGWGRPFDAVAACEALDADILVLQENWMPDGEAGLAPEVGARLGYETRTVTLARAYLYPPAAGPAGPWPGARPRGEGGFGPPVWSRRPVGLRISSARPEAGSHRAPALVRASAGRPPGAPAGGAAGGGGVAAGSSDGTPAGGAAGGGGVAAGSSDGTPAGGGGGQQTGDWGVAVLSRLPITRTETIDLGQLRRDPAHRRALVVETDAGGVHLTVAGVHMSHLTHGSTKQFRRLAHALPDARHHAIVLGDMNLWGPPLRLLLPRWRRAVKGRTWPAWRPLAQIDHILVRPGPSVLESSVHRLGASDHRAVRARIRIG